MALHATFFSRCGLHRYYVYRNSWISQREETLSVKHKEDNLFDRYAIAAVKRDQGNPREKVVGHLPKEISRLLMLHGAQVSLKVIEETYHRSRLVQGGLQNTCFGDNIHGLIFQ